MKKMDFAVNDFDKEINVTLENIIASMPGSVYWKNREGIYLGCNDAIAESLGLTKEEIIGKTDYEIIEKLGWDKKIADCFVKVDAEVMKSGIPKLNFEEIPFVDKNGNIIQQLSNKVPLRNKNGVVIGVLGNSINIADHKKIEQALRKEKEETEATLENVIEHLPQYIYWKDKNLIYRGCNNHVAEYLNLKSPHDVVGKDDYDFGWDRERIESLHKIDKTVLENGSTITVEDIIPKEDGTERVMLSSKSPLFSKENEIIGILGVSVDITDRKKMEEELRIAKEKAEAESKKKSLIVANMSHDVRTPLTGLIAMANSLYEGAHNPTEKGQAHNVLKCSQQLSNLLLSILENFASNHLKDEDIQKTTFDLYKFIEGVCDFCYLNAYNKKIELIKKIDPVISQFVISDHDKLYRALINLVENAIKFTEKGQIIIEVSQQGSIGDQILLKFMVSDTGIGISEDFQDKIFEQFIRETPSNKGKYKGYGLGLHTAQNCITALGGKIQVESEKGKGSTFFFELKMDIGKAEDIKIADFEQEETAILREEFTAPCQTTAIPVTSTIPSTSQIILIVEDDAIAMQAAETAVNRAGYAAIKAMTGEDAFEMAKKSHYDLILSDIGLPEMSGDELAKHIREWEKSIGKKPVPIIALTGNGNDPQVIKACREAGMNKILTKPPNRDELEITLKKFLSAVQPPVEVLDNSQRSKTMTKGLGFELPDMEEGLFQIDFPLLDSKKGIEILGSKNFFLELLPTFIKSIASDKIDLQKVHEEKDWDQLRKLAHRMKSGALTVGAIKMSYACRYFERYYLAGYRDISILEKLYQQLLQVLDETKKAVEDFLTNEKNSH